MLEKLAKALQRMLNLQELMMKQANHSQSAWSAECIKEMNEAPPEARELLLKYEQLKVELEKDFDLLEEEEDEKDEQETKTSE